MMKVLKHNYVEDTNPCLEASYNGHVCNINEFRCYEAKIEESEKGTQDTSGLSRQCSATECI